MTTARAMTKQETTDSPFMYDGILFPHIITNDQGFKAIEECVTWLKENQDSIEKTLVESGAILFRGFPVPTAQEFDRFILTFGYENFPYQESLSNALRTNITERVFTANEAPPEVQITIHHELAQTPVYPTKLFFYCEVPPTEGGATPLCRSDILWNRLEKAVPSFARSCEEKGLLYTNVFAAQSDEQSGQGRSWSSLMNTEDPKQAEAKLASLDYSYEWMEDGSLKVMTPVMQAVKEAPNGKKVFFNQLIAAFRDWKHAKGDPSKALLLATALPCRRRT